MELIRSRQNAAVRRLRALAADAAFRREQGEYLCEGEKALGEALAFGAEIGFVLWKERAKPVPGLERAAQAVAEAELFDYASPMKNSPGPLLTVKMPEEDRVSPVQNALILENVQDPGNVGTVIRGAGAFGIGAVILTGNCADLYHPRTVRATMGAVFRQRVLRLSLEELSGLLEQNGLPLYGAALSEAAEDVRRVPLKRAAVAVGSEGSGLSRELLARCRGQLIIPMRPESESLNAAAAATVLMWEMAR